MHDPISFSKYCILIINCSAYKQSVLILHQILQCTKFLNIVFLFLIIMDINNQFLSLLARYNTAQRYSKIMNNMLQYFSAYKQSILYYYPIYEPGKQGYDTKGKNRALDTHRCGGVPRCARWCIHAIVVSRYAGVRRLWCGRCKKRNFAGL